MSSIADQILKEPTVYDINFVSGAFAIRADSGRSATRLSINSYFTPQNLHCSPDSSAEVVYVGSLSSCEHLGPFAYGEVQMVEELAGKNAMVTVL